MEMGMFGGVKGSCNKVPQLESNWGHCSHLTPLPHMPYFIRFCCSSSITLCGTTRGRQVIVRKCCDWQDPPSCHNLRLLSLHRTEYTALIIYTVRTEARGCPEGLAKQ